MDSLNQVKKDADFFLWINRGMNRQAHRCREEELTVFNVSRFKTLHLPNSAVIVKREAVCQVPCTVPGTRGPR